MIWTAVLSSELSSMEQQQQQTSSAPAPASDLSALTAAMGKMHDVVSGMQKRVHSFSADLAGVRQAVHASDNKIQQLSAQVQAGPRAVPPQTLELTSDYDDDDDDDFVCGACNSGKCTNLGQHKIGHTDLVLVDPDRECRGRLDPGNGRERPVYVRVFYPATQSGNPLVRYSRNNLIYTDPDPLKRTFDGQQFPLLTFNVTYPSLYGARQNAPPAKGARPLILNSHSTFGTADSGADVNEYLASHGYVVVSVEHTGESSSATLADSILDVNVCEPRRFESTLAKLGDMVFVLNEIERRIASPGADFVDSVFATVSVDAQGTLDSVGVQGQSAGGGVAVFLADGIVTSRPVHPYVLSGDPRVKAVFSRDVFLPDPTSSDPSEYQRISAPVMLYSRLDTVSNRFADMINAPHKYAVSVPASHITLLAGNAACRRMRSRLENIEGISAHDGPATQFDDSASFLVADFMSCADQAAVFDGVSQATLQEIVDRAGYGAPYSVEEINNIRAAAPAWVSDVKAAELNNLYSLAFYNVHLNHQPQFQCVLDPRYAGAYAQVHKDVIRTDDRPLDLKEGDRLTFVPMDDNSYDYWVRLREDQELRLDDDDGFGVALEISDDYGDSAEVLLNFNFPTPLGSSNKVYVDNDGQISTQFHFNDRSIGWDPYWRANRLGSGKRFSVAAYMMDFDPDPSGQRKIMFFQTDDRAVFTWLQAPVGFGDYLPGVADATFQIVLEDSGEVGIRFGKLPTIAASYSQQFRGIVGIGAGQAHVEGLAEPVDHRADAVDITNLLGNPRVVSMKKPFFETFYRRIDTAERSREITDALQQLESAGGSQGAAAAAAAASTAHRSTIQSSLRAEEDVERDVLEKKFGY